MLLALNSQATNSFFVFTAISMALILYWYAAQVKTRSGFLLKKINHHIVSGVKSKIHSAFELENVYSLLYGNLSKLYEFKSFAILRYEKKYDTCRIIYSYKKKLLKNKDNPVKTKDCLFLTEKLLAENRDHKEILRLFTDLNIQLLIPFNYRGANAGFLALGPKKYGFRYSNKEIEFLEMICFQVASAFENFSLYETLSSQKEELRKLNHRLKSQVEVKTKELQQSQFEKISHLYRFAEFGRLSSGLFHDLINPLTALTLNLESIQNSKKEELCEMKINLAQAINLARRMDDFIGAVKKQLIRQDEKRSFVVDEEIAHSLDVLTHKAKRNNVRFEQEIEKRIYLYGNPIKFNQVVMNLISNAIDSYDGLEKEDKVVKIILRLIGEVVELCVKDYGSGIQPSFKDKIFDPFFTTKDYNKGIGIGLSSTKNIIENEFAGLISVKSEIDKGSEFVVKINRARYNKKSK